MLTFVYDCDEKPLLKGVLATSLIVMMSESNIINV